MKASGLLTLASLVVAAFLAVPGCGGDDKPKEKKQGDSIECGGLRCDSVLLPQGYEPIPACCAENGACGLDGTRFEEYGATFAAACQPRNQPGELDAECAASEPVTTDFGELSFSGCCTPAGRCGYMVDRALGIILLGLGCVDAAPFLDGGTPTSCTPGPEGGGGAGGSQ
jgi:hypothetical protein